MSGPNETNGQVADELFEAVEPLAYDDAANDNATLGLANALALPLQDIAEIVTPDDGTPPWSPVYDLERCPAEWLPWLGQWVGVEIPEGMDEATARERIAERSGFQRGTVASMVAAVRERLTGSKRVVVRERYEASVAATHLAWRDRFRAAMASLSPTAWWRMDDRRRPSTSVWAEAMETSAPMAWWRLGDAAGSAVAVSQVVNEDVWADLMTTSAPVAWWRMNDLASPPSSNTYDTAMLARSDTLMYWELGEASGTTAANSVSGGAQPGTYGLSGLTRGVTGPLIGSADTGVLTTGTDVVVNLGVPSAAMKTASFSMSLWIKPDNVGTSTRCMFSSVGTTHGFACYVTSFGRINFLTMEATVVDDTLSAGGIIENNRWHHIVLVYDGTTKYVYVDGALAASEVRAYTNASWNATAFNVSTTGGVTRLTGTYSKISWHNAALTEREVGDLFSRGRQVRDTAASTTFAGSVLARADTVALWRLNETAGATTASNSVAGAAHPGTIMNGPRVGVTGPFLGVDNGTAFDFDGVNDGVSIPYNAALNSATFTAHFWCRADSFPASARLFCSLTTGNLKGWNVRSEAGGNVVFGVADGVAFSETTVAAALTVGKWHHVAMTYDGTSRRLYVDGVLKSTVADTYVPNDTAATGIGFNPLTGGSSFDGRISNAAFHNAVLSDAEVAALYAVGVAENAYHGGMLGTLASATGLIVEDADAAIDFDETDKVVVPYTSALATAQFSVAAWVNIDDLSLDRYIMWDRNTADNTGFLFYIRGSDDKPGMAFGNGASYAFPSSSAVLTAGRTHHVAATYDGTTLRWYVDGVAAGTNVNTFAPSTGGPIGIGATHGGSVSMDGRIDEVGYWNRALSATEIADMHAAGYDADHAGELLPGGSLPTFGVAGAILGDTDTALQFDGTNDLMRVPYSPRLNPPTVFTVGAWVYLDSAGNGTTRIIMASRDSATETTGYILYATTGNTMNFRVYKAAAANVEISGTIGTNRWSYVAATYDGTNLRLYVDGQLAAGPTALAGTFERNTTGMLGIGSNPSGGNYMRGMIDEPAVWDRVLSATEIVDLFVEGRPVRDEQDTHDGGMVGGVENSLGAVAGDDDAALDFAASAGSRIVVPYASALNAATFSVVGLVRRDVDTAGTEIIVMSRLSTTHGWNLRVTSTDKLALQLCDGAGASETTGTTSLAAGQWYLVAATYDGTNARIYVNGALETTAADAYAANTSAPLVIGRALDSTAAFDGDIDELAYLGGVVLTGSQISDLYDAWVEAEPPADAPYHINVRTYADETPDEAAALTALLTRKPAGLVLDYAAVAGQSWQDLIDTYDTWQEVIDEYPSWQDAIDDIPG